jgi:hypothetical protein
MKKGWLYWFAINHQFHRVHQVKGKKEDEKRDTKRKAEKQTYRKKYIEK